MKQLRRPDRIRRTRPLRARRTLSPEIAAELAIIVEARRALIDR